MEADRQQLELWDHEHLWHPFTPMAVYTSEPPVIIERAEGCYLYDLNGNRYIDGVGSLWCNYYGHQVPELDAAIRDQLDRVAHSTLLGLSNVPAIKLARKLVEITPEALTHVFFSDDGATAVEVALKMAFQYWQQRSDPRPQKTKYLALSQAYHGDTIGSVSLGGIAHFHAMFEPLLFDTVRAPQHYCYRCPLGLERSTCQIDCATELENMVRAHHHELAAVVMEPLVQGAAGMIVAPDGYLRRAREVTEAHEVLLIADEVVTGMGRMGTVLACDQEGVTPDLLCLAKGLTGGYLPLSATLATDEIYQAFLGKPEEGRTLYHGHTYAGNPLGAAVALASIELMEKKDLLNTVKAKAELLSQWLEPIAGLPGVGDVRQKGLLAGIELVSDRRTKEPFAPEKRLGALVCQAASKRGAWLRPLGDVLILMPPLVIEEDLLKELCDILHASIEEVASPLAVA